MKFLCAAEAVARGHPDKACDQVSDAILDAYLALDPKARVDITCMLSHDTLFLAGEISSSQTVNIEAVAKNVLADIGYTSKENGFDVAACKTHIEICRQSEDIAQAVQKGAGDQGIVIGYATDETPEYIVLSTIAVQSLSQTAPDG